MAAEVGLADTMNFQVTSSDYPGVQVGQLVTVDASPIWVTSYTIYDVGPPLSMHPSLSAP
jgi:hypothetical protein